MFVNMNGRPDVLMCWIVAVRAGRGDFDLRLGLRLCGFTPHMGGFEDYGKALTSRRGYALGRAFILDRLMGVRALRTEVIHRNDGVDDKVVFVSGVEGWMAVRGACV